jgi:hypothetical protein
MLALRTIAVSFIVTCAIFALLAWAYSQAMTP